jgi:hypothetical protein
MSSEHTWAPGWYNDPERPNTLRYYNGVAWEDKFAPAGAQPVRAAAVESNSYVIGFGILFAILLPVVGFVIGLTQINKKDGLLVVVLSVISFVIWFLILQDQFGESAPSDY